MKIAFEEKLAKQFGLEEAIILQQFKKEPDGFYKSYKDWEKEYDYVGSHMTIQRCLQNLVEKEIIVKENAGKAKPTFWKLTEQGKITLIAK